MIGLLHLPLGDELESNNLTAAFAAALVDLAERALTDRVQHVVLVHLLQPVITLVTVCAFSIVVTKKVV